MLPDGETQIIDVMLLGALPRHTDPLVFNPDDFQPSASGTFRIVQRGDRTDRTDAQQMGGQRTTKPLFKPFSRFDDL